MSTAPGAGSRGTLLDRALRPFADVHAGEGANALMLMLNVFLLLCAYYLLKTVREPLILTGSGGGAEIKSYAAAGQALLLLALVPAYGWVASHVNRAALIGGVTAFFIVNLLIFYALAQRNTPGLGIAFFLWVGIFNLMIIAQFWSFANDVYTREQGERLFAIVGFGSTSGAIAGAWLARQLIDVIGVYPLMLIAAGMLVVCIALTLVVNRRSGVARPAPGGDAPHVAAAATGPVGGTRNGFALVLTDRYLLLIALLMMVLNFVNTNGEYILGKAVTAEAARHVATGDTGGMIEAGAYTRLFVGRFYADYFGWVNLVAAIVQLFLVSRIMKWLGVRAALFVMPLLALGGYGLLAFAPILALVRIAKIGENATDYSLQNTVRQALWLPTSREAKYKAKSAIDSFFVRGGDLLSTALVFLGARWALTTQHFAMINVVLVLVWLLVVLQLGREHRRVSGEAAPAG
jgi:AAA family ATP:ADP antiporter